MSRNATPGSTAGKGWPTRIAALVAALVVAVAIGACSTTTSSDATDSSADAAQEQQAALTVTVEIDGTAADVDAVSADVELDEGATAYDALVEAADDVNASETDYGMYVQGINGLAGGDHGDMSGWLYYVNGEMADVGCSEYVLEDGDVVSWVYTTDYSQM